MRLAQVASSRHAVFPPRATSVFRMVYAIGPQDSIPFEEHVQIKLGDQAVVHSGASNVSPLHNVFVVIHKADNLGVASSSSWDQLIACGGTKYCCSSTGSDCCSKANLVFDIGTPTVVKDFNTGSAQSTTSSAQYSLITATLGASTATADSAKASGSGAPAASSNSTSGIGTGTIVGICVGITTFIVIAAVSGLVYCCVYKRKKKAAAPNLIDMNSPNAPNSSVLSPGSSHGGKFAGGQSAPPSPWGEPAPPYPSGQKEYYGSNQDLLPRDSHGSPLIELQSPASMNTGPNGQHVHELHSPAPKPVGPGGYYVHELA
jgi:hypothetical protein